MCNVLKSQRYWITQILGQAVRASAKSSVLAPARHHAWRNTAISTISVLLIAKQRIPATLTPEDAQEWRATVEQAEVFTGLP